MKKLTISCFVAALCAAAVADTDTAKFSYGITLDEKFSTNSVTVASLTETLAVEGETPTADTLASVFMNDTLVQAMDVEDWVVSTNAIGSNVQAAFTLLDDNGTLKWMGFTNGRWVQLAGVVPIEGIYDVKIDFDYSLALGSPDPARIRYSIRMGDSSDDYVELTNGDDAWFVIGMATSSITGIDLCGYATTGAVGAQSGARKVEGSVDGTVEDVGLAYDSLKLTVNATHGWGVDSVKVTLNGSTEITKTFAELEANGNVIDLSSSVVAGETYSYDVSLIGLASGLESDSHKVGEVPMYSSDAWFYFNRVDAFENANTERISFADGKFFATDEDAEGLVTPKTTPPTNLRTIVATTIDIASACVELPAFEDGQEPQFAVALSQDGWRYYSFADRQWKAVDAELPTETGEYACRATFNYTNKTVRYEIRKASQVDDAYQLLVEAALPSEKTQLSVVGVCGGGEVSVLEVNCDLAAPIPVKPTQDGDIELHSNAYVDLANVDEGEHTVTSEIGKMFHLRWNDDLEGGKYAKLLDGKLTVCAGAPANGLESFSSYALGLNPTVALDKPAAVVKPGGMQSETGVTVHVPNVVKENLPDAGVEVLFQRQKSTDKGLTWTDDGAAVPVGGELTIPFTPETLYRVNTVLK